MVWGYDGRRNLSKVHSRGLEMDEEYFRGDKMFTVNREELKESIKIMKADVCAYGQKEIGSMCDCKYRNGEDHHKPFSESFSGCCELSNVYLLLDKMTNEEYNEILKR